MYNNVEKIKNSQLRKEDWQAFIEPDYAVSKQGESLSLSTGNRFDKLYG